MMDEYAEYVAGKTIAVVGRARPFADQSEEVEAHDLVTVTSYQGNPIAQYHRRCDINICPRAMGPWLQRKKSRARLLGPEWFLFRTARWSELHGVKSRVIGGPAFFGGLGNQVPVFLNDIVRFRPDKVTVYGTDLYLSGYDTERPGGAAFTFQQTKDAMIEHDQPKVHRYYQLLFELYPFLTPDSRLDRIIGMSNEEFRRELSEVWGGL